MPAESRERRGPLRWLTLGLGVTLAGAFVALLAWGVLTAAPDGTIDDSLAGGRPAPAPGYRLEVLQRGRWEMTSRPGWRPPWPTARSPPRSCAASLTS